MFTITTLFFFFWFLFLFNKADGSVLNIQFHRELCVSAGLP